jgi:very-short-patch-repair endonuclease
MRLKRATTIFTDRARGLRRASTEAETLLWEQLRRKSFDVKFRRQRPIGPYIVDFYCPQYGLVLELDGSHHNELDGAEYDEERTTYLAALGLKVLRFKNEEVLADMDTVLARIREATPSPPRSPSPCEGEGEGGEG